MSLTRDSVYLAIRGQITRGELPSGSPLVATRLAASVKASRTPVREALLRLLAEGLAAETPVGLVVKGLAEEDIMEIYEVRIPLEAACARRAAENRTPLTLARIQVLHERLGTVIEQDRDAVPSWVGSVGLDFHRAICEAARSRLLLEFMSRITDSLTRFNDTTLRHPGRFREALQEHDAILSAIKDRDPDRAESHMRAHVERARQLRLEMYREERRSGMGRT